MKYDYEYDIQESGIGATGLVCSGGLLVLGRG